jgi:hypothetical protein
MAARPPRVLISNSCNNNEKENENMAKKSTKFIALLLTVLMVITLLPMSVLADDATPTYSDKTTAATDTGVTADKTVSGPDADGNYTITLSTVGSTSSSSTESKAPADVVLVIDSSGSMDWCGGTLNLTQSNVPEKHGGGTYDIYTCAICGKTYRVKHGNPAPQYCTKTDTTTPDRIDNAKAAVSGFLADNPQKK